MSHKRIILIATPLFVLILSSGCVKASSYRVHRVYDHDRNYVVYPSRSYYTTFYVQPRYGYYVRHRHIVQPRRHIQIRRSQAHSAVRYGRSVTPRHPRRFTVQPRRHRMDRGHRINRGRMGRSTRSTGHSRSNGHRSQKVRRIHKDR